MRLSEVIDAYIAMQTSLGMSFDSARRLLRQFSREIENPTIGEVQVEAVAAFLRGRGALSATWALKYRILVRLLQVRDQSRACTEFPLAGHRAEAAAPAITVCLFGR